MNDGLTALAVAPIRKSSALRVIEATWGIPLVQLTADSMVSTSLSLSKELFGQDPDADRALDELIIKSVAVTLVNTPSVTIQSTDGSIDHPAIDRAPGSALLSTLCRCHKRPQHSHPGKSA